ncbi:hypothetical protein [Peribacillus simplex]|uniref:Uncharacterized protein n=1 Tax=Peribacillus simplex TaxID=1478 RepID=A0AAN2PFZ9_9BACI|nr:hypothetical protein [Peribacillus simplex]CEG31424.1 hypothetical protein BN1180_01568 [Peribacillus simplex]
MVNNNKGVNIPSIEAEDIYDMSVRGLENIMKFDYIGYIPYSLELIKLRSYKKMFSENEIIKNKKVKYQSDAIINIKFKNKLKGGKQITSNIRGYDNLISRLTKQLEHLDKKIPEVEEEIRLSNNKREKDKLEKTVNYYKNKAKLVKGHIERIRIDKNKDEFNEMNASKLRNHLYTKGFSFKNRRYVFYKRTASKSRNSQALFILEELHEPMQEWSRMGLKFEEGKKYDVASLLAYESLVSSSISNAIQINHNNIFIINDEFSLLEDVESIEVGNDLKAVFNENAKIENNIWDGQALIDISLMESIGQGKAGSAQLRQHFFKCCAFNTNIQLFLRNKHKEMTNPESVDYDSTINPDYDKWKLTDLYNNKIAAKQILFITTPSALKFMKFAEKGKEKEAYANWKKYVRKDKLFGICKHEKSSKYDDRSFTSYQMINTLDADMDSIKELAEFEVNYIKSLQGIKDEDGNIDEEPFIEYLRKKKELTNAYSMLYDMYQINPEIVRTQMFRDYRTKQISNYRTKIKGGKLRTLSDYCTVVSSPYEMMLSVINKLKDENGEVISHTLQDNQVYTTLHEFEKTYTTVRNPHNAMNNFYKVFNTKNELIEKYFNFKDAPNIVVITAIKSPILVVCNGMDQDGDTLLIFKDEIFNSIIDKTLAKRKYPIISNTIVSKPDPVYLTNENISIIDEKTSKSQMWIGEVTNAAQFQVSVLWDIQNTEPDTPERQDKIDEIMNNLAILVVLSNVAIDYSKKIVEVDVDKALRQIRSSKATKVEEVNPKGRVKLKSRKKPMFWKYVSTSKVEMEEFNCPMDILINHINDIEQASYRKNLSLSEMLIDMTREKRKEADHKQIKDIVKLVKKFDKKIKEVNSESDGDKRCQERQTLLENSYNDLDEKIGKKKIKKATLLIMLSLIAENYDKKESEKSKKNNTSDFSGITIHLLNTLYRNHGKTFLSLIEKNSKK